MLRIGFGFDTHKLEEEHPFFLGGIELFHSKGAVGHSDADVLIHAICDALFGAAAMRDIGFHFSDKDPAFKGIDSKEILIQTCKLIRGNSFEIQNIDSTVVLQSPKISEFIPEMVSLLSSVMNLEPGQLSIKAKTSERLGFIGREEGISAYAIALLLKA